MDERLVLVHLRARTVTQTCMSRAGILCIAGGTRCRQALLESLMSLPCVQVLLGWYDTLERPLASLVTTRQLLVVTGSVVWRLRIHGSCSTRKGRPSPVVAHGWRVRRDIWRAGRSTHGQPASCFCFWALWELMVSASCATNTSPSQFSGALTSSGANALCL